ncbi:MAG: multidrug ABC transporter ATP-binding protein, partial [Rivularia sp. (in: cyanobacteria)]
MKSVEEAAFSPDTTQDSPIVLTSELRKVYRTGFWMNQKV